MLYKLDQIFMDNLPSIKSIAKQFVIQPFNKIKIWIKTVIYKINGYLKIKNF